MEKASYRTPVDQQWVGGLPEYCYAVSPHTGCTVRVVRGEKWFQGIHGHEDAETLNRRLHVPRAVTAAMVGGVLHGWSSPQAKPENYAPSGAYKGEENA